MNAQRLRVLGVILWGILGFVGLGIGAGAWWIERASANTSVSAPVVRFLAPISSSAARHSRAISSMDDLLAMADADPARDLDAFLNRAVQEMDEPARDAFLRMLRTAVARGDRFARRALTSIARTQCGVLATISGRSSTDDDRRRCADDLIVAVGAPEGSERQERIARLAELTALLDAGIATPYVIGAFCATAADATDIPVGFMETISALLTLHCAGSSSNEEAPDGGD